MDRIAKMYVKANQLARGQTMTEYAPILGAGAIGVFGGFHRGLTMMGRAHLKSNERGQTFTEFAIVASVFFLLLFGVIDFATAIYSYSEVAYSANAGARWASVRGSTASSPAVADDVKTYVAGNMPSLGSSSATSTCPPDTTSGAFEVCTTWPTDNHPGSVVQVQVQYNFQLAIPMMSAVTLPLTATTQMMISQ